MRFAVGIVIACTGCKSLLGIDDGVVAEPGADARVDDAMPDASACVGPDEFAICSTTPPAQTTSFVTETTIDTTLCIQGSLDPRGWCVISARTMSIDAHVHVVGSRPAVFFATTSLIVSVNGLVDASSGTGIFGGSGAGANPSECPAAGTGMAAPAGGGGGAGGTLGTRGGNGGFGASGQTARGVSTPVVAGAIGLRGGCKGGKGGAPSAVAGDGGGAVYLVAGDTLLVHGMINASGGGGGAGNASKGGGSGGGSGGVVFLAAPMITVDGAIWAHGGGGGGGADNGASGSPGGVSTAPTVVGAGGAPGSTLAGRGGNGGSGAAAGSPGTDDTTGAGGGGGGGGVGVIRVFGTVSNAGTISPPPS